MHNKSLFDAYNECLRALELHSLKVLCLKKAELHASNGKSIKTIPKVIFYSLLKSSFGSSFFQSEISDIIYSDIIVSSVEKFNIERKLYF